MPQKPDQKLIFRFQKLLFLIFLILMVLPLGALHIASKTGNFNQYGWWLASFLIVWMGADQLFGKEIFYSTGDQLKYRQQSFYYSFLLFLCLPAATALSVYSAYFFSNTNELNWAGRIGWIISLGLPISVLALCAGHELIHRDKLIERLSGGYLFAFVCMAAHKIDHVRGHHVNVATPEDSGSADLNQSFYHFLPQAIKKTFVNAWRHEKKRLNRNGNKELSWHNQLISGYLVSLGIGAVYLFFFGLPGIIFFIGQSLIALTWLHLVNYIQHYGLKRRKLDDGRHEKFCAAHAWNCNYLISNMVTFCLPRHTDHHLNPRRPYHLLQHLAESPQMPFGYFGMFFMALIPPLWFKVMNPRVLAYNKKEEEFHKPIKSISESEMSAYFSAPDNQ